LFISLNCLEFEIWVIEIYLDFVFWDLEFYSPNYLITELPNYHITQKSRSTFFDAPQKTAPHRDE
jgi:hypothetical protein